MNFESWYYDRLSIEDPSVLQTATQPVIIFTGFPKGQVRKYQMVIHTLSLSLSQTHTIHQSICFFYSVHQLIIYDKRFYIWKNWNSFFKEILFWNSVIDIKLYLVVASAGQSAGGDTHREPPPMYTPGGPLLVSYHEVLCGHQCV